MTKALSSAINELLKHSVKSKGIEAAFFLFLLELLVDEDSPLVKDEVRLALRDSNSARAVSYNVVEAGQPIRRQEDILSWKET